VQHDADFLDPGFAHFLDQDGERGLGGAIAVDERLQGKRALSPAGGGDDGFADIHGVLRCGGASQIRRGRSTAADTVGRHPDLPLSEALSEALSETFVENSCRRGLTPGGE
jgi:hypothetical protein